MSHVTFGWCPPANTATAVADMFTAYPNTAVARHFRTATQGLFPWTSGVMGATPSDVDVMLSYKGDPLNPNGDNLYDWLTDMPARTGRVFLIWQHEPEQQTGGDPTPAAFRAGYEAIIGALASHPRRAEVLIGPVYTEFYWRNNASTAQTDFWPAAVASDIDFIGWDVYQTGYPLYRTPEHMWEISRQYADSLNKPYIIGEWGIERRTSGADNDPDGTICAQVMIDQAVDIAADDRCQSVAWFHFGGDDLIAQERDPERDALQWIFDNLNIEELGMSDVTLLNASANAAGTNLEGAWFAIQDGATSADQVSTQRLQPVYGAAAAGVADLSATLSFTGTSSATVSHLGVWTAETDGAFRFAVPLSGDLAFNAEGDLNLTSAPITLT